MASITSINIASTAAAADVSQTQRAAQIQRQSSSSPGQDTQQQRQAISAVNAAKLKVGNEKTPDTPKKVEASFDPQKEKSEPEIEKKKDSKESGSDSQSLDVVA